MPCRTLERGKTVVDERLSSSTLLWRYIDSAKLLDFLHYGRLYFCRGDLFQDKFEGQFTQSLRKLIEHSYEKNDIDFTYEKFRHGLHQQIYLSCWHQSDKESMAMWRIYGDSTCSVALITTVENFRNTLDKQNLSYLLSIEKVEYIDYSSDPHIDISPYSRVFAYKHFAYEYEREVRILIDMWQQNDAFEMEIKEKGKYVAIDPNEFLKEIIVAPFAPRWFFKLIEDLSKDLDVPIRSSALAVDPI